MRKIPLFWIALLVCSGVLNIVLYNTAWHYYRALNAMQLDPLGLAQYDEIAPVHKATEARVLFFGDSRAHQWPAPSQEQRFEFINRGIGGQTSAQVLLRFDAHVKPLQPNIVIVQVGINDLKTIPLFPEQKVQIIAECQQNIKTIVEKARQLGATVILSTLFPVGDISLERRLIWSDDVAEAIAEVNHFLGTLMEPQVILFDAAAILADTPTHVRREFQGDFLHINAKGYAALNAELTPLLDALDQ